MLFIVKQFKRSKISMLQDTTAWLPKLPKVVTISTDVLQTLQCKLQAQTEAQSFYKFFYS